MEIISYGAASKAASTHKNTKDNVLGTNVEGTHTNVKERIDSIEGQYKSISELADSLIVKDAVNIMKAHARLNAYTKGKRYKMHNMIFDDLLDLSGVDTSLSSGYTHNATGGYVDGGTIVTRSEATDAIPSKVILTVEEESGTIIPKLSSNSQNGYSASASSTFGTDWAAWRAFDRLKGLSGGNSNNRWAASSGDKTGWIQIKLPEKRKIQSYALTSNPLTDSGGSSQSGQNVKSWALLGSNDNSTWTTLDERTNQPQWVTNETRVFEVNTSAEYSYYRIKVNEIFGGPLACIGEIELFQKQEGNVGAYYISRNNGVTWEAIKVDELFYFDDNVSPIDNKIRIKAVLPSGTKILNYGLTWS